MVGDIVTKQNPRIADIRARNGFNFVPPAVVEEPVEDESVQVEETIRENTGHKRLTTRNKRMCTFLKVLKTQGPKTQRELEVATMVVSSQAWVVLKDLEEADAVSVDYSGKAKVYSYKQTPEGWDLNAVDEIKPGTTEVTVISDNPLTRMLEKKNPTVKMDRVSGYQNFINDTKKSYGIKELDDVITVLHKICQDRILSATSDCPVCGRTLTRDGTAVICTKCRLNIDRGDSMKSLDAFLRNAKIILGVEE